MEGDLGSQTHILWHYHPVGRTLVLLSSIAHCLPHLPAGQVTNQASMSTVCCMTARAAKPELCLKTVWTKAPSVYTRIPLYVLDQWKPATETQPQWWEAISVQQNHHPHFFKGNTKMRQSTNGFFPGLQYHLTLKLKVNLWLPCLNAWICCFLAVLSSVSSCRLPWAGLHLGDKAWFQTLCFCICQILMFESAVPVCVWLNG